MCESVDNSEGANPASRIGRLIDVLSDSTGIISVLALFGMTAIVCYEVVSRVGFQ